MAWRDVYQWYVDDEPEEPPEYACPQCGGRSFRVDTETVHYGNPLLDDETGEVLDSGEDVVEERTAIFCADCNHYVWIEDMDDWELVRCPACGGGGDIGSIVVDFSPACALCQGQRVTTQQQAEAWIQRDEEEG